VICRWLLFACLRDAPVTGLFAPAFLLLLQLAAAGVGLRIVGHGAVPKNCLRRTIRPASDRV
jgi:hypothetical protein